MWWSRFFGCEIDRAFGLVVFDLHPFLTSFGFGTWMENDVDQESESTGIESMGWTGNMVQALEDREGLGDLLMKSDSNVK